MTTGVSRAFIELLGEIVAVTVNSQILILIILLPVWPGHLAPQEAVCALNILFYVLLKSM